MRKYLFVFVAFLLTACAALQAPVSTEDRMMYTQAQLIAAYGSIADLAEQGRISKAQAVNLLVIADETGVMLGIAKAALDAGDATGGQQMLQMIHSALLQLETTLREKQNE